MSATLKATNAKTFAMTRLLAWLLLNPEAFQQISQSVTGVKGMTGIALFGRKSFQRRGGEFGGGLKECLSGIIECVFEFDRRGGI